MQVDEVEHWGDSEERRQCGIEMIYAQGADAHSSL